MTKRQPKGTPVGGQFAQDRKPDGGELVAPRRGRVIETEPWSKKELISTKVFFAKRVAEQNRQEPDYAYRWYSLDQRLVGIGGVSVVPPVDAETDIDQLLSIAELSTTKPVMRKGKPNQCHANTARLWISGEIDEIYTGYALSADGLWRQHSWGRKGEKIVETTSPRLGYFGFAVPNPQEWAEKQE